jgi:hypothetical protein
MKKYPIFAAFLALSLVGLGGLTACDDGPVYESTSSTSGDSRSVTVEGTFTGWEGWTDGYSVVVAGFEEDNDYAVISKPITASEGGLTLSQIPESVTTVALCVINRLRQRVATFQEEEFTLASGTMTMNVGTLNVGMFNCIQQTVFNTTCAHCHGGSGHSAAGLNLTEGNSHASLVDHASKKVEDGILVKPGDADGSVLPQVLGSQLTATWGYDHSKEVLSSLVLDMIDTWINAGAEE